MFIPRWRRVRHGPLRYSFHIRTPGKPRHGHHPDDRRPSGCEIEMARGPPTSDEVRPSPSPIT